MNIVSKSLNKVVSRVNACHFRQVAALAQSSDLINLSGAKYSSLSTNDVLQRSSTRQLNKLDKLTPTLGAYLFFSTSATTTTETEGSSEKEDVDSTSVDATTESSSIDATLEQEDTSSAEEPTHTPEQDQMGGGDMEPEIPLDRLVVGTQVMGKVKSITGFGAFIDVGAARDGLLHISKMSDRFVEDPSDIVNVGDDFMVYIENVDVSQQRISLSKFPPGEGGGPNSNSGRSRPQRDVSKYADFDPKEVLTGRITTVVEFGIFVDLGDNATGLVHKSQLPGGTTFGYGEVGDEVEVRVIHCDVNKNRLGLSCLPYEEESRNSY